MTRSLIPVVTKNSEILVDSREIAKEMEVIHAKWINNIVQKYQKEIEENFGVFRFKNAKSKGGRPEKYCMLTEDQAYYVLTLSRNSPKVVQLKAKLVRSFSQCRMQIEALTSSQRRRRGIPNLTIKLFCFNRIYLDTSKTYAPDIDTSTDLYHLSAVRFRKPCGTDRCPNKILIQFASFRVVQIHCPVSLSRSTELSAPLVITRFRHV